VPEVVREVEALCAKGVREVTLLGQTVEAYGKDLPLAEGGTRPDLADLFSAVHDLPGLQRIRFLTSYPADLTGRIISAVASLPKVCEHFNIPLQSGDDDILRLMRRGYTVGQYLECVERIRREIPQASLSTDVIVGFCGETEEQFLHTVDILEALRFDKVHVAAYSPRPGTIAWRHLEDSVPHDEKMRRLHAVEALQERIASQINAGLVGSIQEVLVEGSQQAPDGGLVFTGRNRGNKLVHFRIPIPPGNGASAVSRPAAGDLVPVRIQRATAWSLQGEMALPVPA
jgi:tRNA-2-methylthio-N6-dimethylallyladenosine synthase